MSLPNLSVDFLTMAFEEAQRIVVFFNQTEQKENINKAVQKMASVIEQGGTLFSCGNGGSFCDAMHFAEELSGRFRKERPALKAISISDGAHITCVGNDYGFDQIYSRFIEAHGRSGDLLLAISTSGNSPNIINAVKMALKKQMTVVALLGKGGGQLKELATLSLIVPEEMASTSDRIQELHIKLIHLFIEGIERTLFPSLYETSRIN